MWGRNTRVVVIPSILVIGLLGQSTHYPHLLIPADISKLPLAFWAMYTSGLQVVSTTHISYVGFRGRPFHINRHECAHDSANCIQDPQGVLASQNDIRRPNFGCHWREHTLAYPICNN